MEQVSFSSPVSVMGVIDDDADDDGHKLKSLMMTAILQSDLYSGVHMYFSSHQIVFPKSKVDYFCLDFQMITNVQNVAAVFAADE